jgi:uncharacterized protein (TIGR02231 family)
MPEQWSTPRQEVPMRPAFPAALAVLLALVPAAALADRIEARSRVVAVTVYPWGASVTRLVEFEAPAGAHELIVPDLPPGIDVSLLRLAGAAGLTIGAVTLATGRLPVPAAEPTDAERVAEAEVERLQAVLRARDEAIAAIRLRVDAANERWQFLRALGSNDGVAALDPARLVDLARMVGDETLAARQAAHAAEIEAAAGERARKDDAEALERAELALAALRTEAAGRAVLTLGVVAGGEGPAKVEVTTFTHAATWRPVYDLRLVRGAVPALTVERSALVSQASGEDWRGVALTLSTARPMDRSAPGAVSSWLRRIVREDEVLPYARGVGGSAEMDAMLSAVPEAAPAPVADKAMLDFQGLTAIYRYGNAVDVRDGVEDLRLKLDDLSFAPEVMAVAVPSLDTTAFAVATLVNEAGEVILPGQASLWLDGAMVGTAALPLIAPGAGEDIGFGPLDGLRLTRVVPARSEGERGLLSSRNQQDEVAILKVENLTGEDWPIRVLDCVPYSEQDDLTVTVTAAPPATETDVDGQRGVLAWEFDLPAGQTREIRLEHSITWPPGYVLE